MSIQLTSLQGIKLRRGLYTVNGQKDMFPDTVYTDKKTGAISMVTFVHKQFRNNKYAFDDIPDEAFETVDEDDILDGSVKIIKQEKMKENKVVSRKKINETISLVNKIQKITGKKVIFESKEDTLLELIVRLKNNLEDIATYDFKELFSVLNKEMSSEEKYIIKMKNSFKKAHQCIKVACKLLEIYA